MALFLVGGPVYKGLTTLLSSLVQTVKSVRKYHSLRRNEFIGKHYLPVDYFFHRLSKKWLKLKPSNQVSNFYFPFLSLTFILYLDLFDFLEYIFTNVFFFLFLQFKSLKQNDIAQRSRRNRINGCEANSH